MLLHNFPSGYSSGPGSGVIQATDGNYYGSVEGGDMAYEDPSGKIFELTPAGVLTYLVVFNVTDGATPAAALSQATHGEFSGSTAGDVSGGATLFSLATGLGPFVKTLTGAGAAGSVVQILGTSLTGATSVSFNGRAAQFRVISASEIAAILPAGATTGKIQVMTPNGTLISDKKFRVLP